jgi:ubiquinone/menaquinone biosynthesis C-methylase UbiE
MKTNEYFRKSRFKQDIIYASMNTSLMLKAVFNGLRFEDINSILDIGCGEASEISSVAERDIKPSLIVGIDICAHPQKWQIYAKRQNYLHFILASANNLPLKPNLFDFVLIKDVLHHVSGNRVKAIIKGAFSVVRDSGVLRIVEANRYHIYPISVFKRDKSHNHFTIGQMRSIKTDLSFDELKGFELLPSGIKSKRNLLWNGFVMFFWLHSSWRIGKCFLLQCVKLKEKLFPSYLTYYVLSRKKR